ncbi:hypothetical protein ACYSNM_08310 [Myroides sp. LJL116]
MYNKFNKDILKYLPKEFSEEKIKEISNLLIFTIENTKIVALEYFNQEVEDVELKEKFVFEFNKYINYVLGDSSDIIQILNRLGKSRFLNSLFEIFYLFIESFFTNSVLNGKIDFGHQLNLCLTSLLENDSEEVKYECVFILALIEVVNREKILLKVQGVIFNDETFLTKLFHDKKHKLVDKASLSKDEFGISKETLIKLIKNSTHNADTLLGTYFLSMDQISEIIKLLVFYPDELRDLNAGELSTTLGKISTIRTATHYYMQNNDRLDFDIQKISFVLKKIDILRFLRLIDPSAKYNDKKVKNAIVICDLDSDDTKDNNDKMIPFKLFEQAVFCALNEYSREYKDIKTWNDIFPEMEKYIVI